MPEYIVKTLGRMGDGTVSTPAGEHFAPFTLPGERIEASGNGKRLDVVNVLDTSPERVDPPCPHFGKCGGCQLQHFHERAYEAWKRQLLLDSLQRADISFSVDPLIGFPVNTRRKAVFNARRNGSSLEFGFAERGTNRISAIDNCLVLSPKLTAMLGPLRDLAASLPLGNEPVRISALDAETGCDVNLEGRLKLTAQQKTALSQKTTDLDIIRLSVNGEIIIEQQKPLLKMGVAKVCPPPGGFVQAVKAAEEVMASLVIDHLSGCKQVTDLFCGSGTFALRLAGQSKVQAVEENPEAISALDRAWRETGGELKQVVTEVRNLERRPLSFQELKKSQGLVFDPPRAGAEMQSRQIAKSRVSRVAAVSCNPQTLVRDLSILIEGGYQITRIVPIDQFRYTPHLEVVTLLQR